MDLLSRLGKDQRREGTEGGHLCGSWGHGVTVSARRARAGLCLLSAVGLRGKGKGSLDFHSSASTPESKRSPSAEIRLLSAHIQSKGDWASVTFCFLCASMDLELPGATERQPSRRRSLQEAGINLHDGPFVARGQRIETSSFRVNASGMSSSRGERQGRGL